MTPLKFLLFTFLQTVIFVLLKVWSFNSPVFDGPIFQNIFFWLLTAAITAIFVRRFGVISYLEAVFLVFVWTSVGFLADLIFVTPFTGLDIFAHYTYWLGLVAMDLTIFLLHKKRHIHIRKLHAAHHGHH